MAKKKKSKKGSNSSSPNNGARAKIKAEIESRQAAKKAAKRAALLARGIDPDKKKPHHNKRRKAALPCNDDVTLNHDIVYTIVNGKLAVDDSNVVYDGDGHWSCRDKASTPRLD